ncbi:unnamed protein product [Parascedosporium putredinis]|uniref:Uncharacterized protein n=1 Tax=Parascedosporium putredinis TaxID=1442378 RepID=A0A9P1M7H7_9PEZI|nr:unnamed protein product [Parascedosporium putredinis]CAI7988367.1 unnamed protein product [Parascedosporium putredinis]
MARNESEDVAGSAVLKNPFNFQTQELSTSPVKPVTIAIFMFGLGLRLAVSQGLMLLMSYGGNKSVDGVIKEIDADPGIGHVEEAQFWQVHYGLGMANLRIRVPKGSDEGALSRLRHRVASLVQDRLGEGYGQGGSLRWDVTVQMMTDAHI